jgi:hypothetical protein
MTQSKPIEVTMDQSIFEDFGTQEEIMIIEGRQPVLQGNA